MKFTTKMVLGFSIITFVLLAITASYSYIKMNAQLTEKTNSQIETELITNTSLLNSWLSEKAENLQATAMILSDTAADHMSVDYVRHYKEDPDMIKMYIGLPDGIFLDGSGWTPPPDYNPTTRDWYKNAQKSKSVVFSDPYIDADTKKLVITPSMQITDEKGEMTGVLGAIYY